MSTIKNIKTAGVLDESCRIVNMGSWKQDQYLRALSRPFKPGRVFKRASSLKRFYLVLGDLAALMGSAFGGYLLTLLLRPMIWPSPSKFDAASAMASFPIMFGPSMLLIIIASEYFGHYSRFRPFWDEYGQFIKIVITVAGLTGIYLVFSKSNPSRLWLATTWGLVLILVPIMRVLVKRWLMVRGQWFTPTIIIGSGANAEASALAMESNILMGFNVVALYDPAISDEVEHHKSINDFLTGEERVYPLRPLNQESLESIDRMDATYIVLALESEDYIRYQSLLMHLASTRRNMSIIPPLRGLPLLGAEITPIFRHEVLHLRVKNNLAQRIPKMLKRGFDIAASLVLLILLSPVFAVLSVRIKSDGGPIFFSQRRIGKEGKEFSCYKFRSMCVNADEVLEELLATDSSLAEEWKKDHKLKDDPRVTPVGKVMRKLSLDELPQIYNVLKGDMSMVGPRPIRKDEMVKYGDQIAYYLETRPGITGLWQISGRNDVSYNTRVNLDAWYVRNWSLWYDIVILMKTAGVVVRGDGAY